jgi:hypothetical protein
LVAAEAVQTGRMVLLLDLLEVVAELPAVFG